MFHRPALLKSTCTKGVEVSQTPTLILEEEKDKGTAKQSHSSGTETDGASCRATGVAIRG